MEEERILECPFKKTEKDIGHKPYTNEEDGFWYVQCTCGAKGPMMPNQEMARKAWNNRSI